MGSDDGGTQVGLIATGFATVLVTAFTCCLLGDSYSFLFIISFQPGGCGLRLLLLVLIIDFVAFPATSSRKGECKGSTSCSRFCRRTKDDPPKRRVGLSL